jgi:hypothetical protein
MRWMDDWVFGQRRWRCALGRQRATYMYSILLQNGVDGGRLCGEMSWRGRGGGRRAIVESGDGLHVVWDTGMRSDQMR